MIKKTLFTGAIIGLLLPYALFIPFLFDDGSDLSTVLGALFDRRISGALVVDVIVSTLVLWRIVYAAALGPHMNRLKVYLACILLVGLSLAVPLFLYFRAFAMEATGVTP